MFRRRLLVTNRLLVFEIFKAHIITLIIVSPKRIVIVLFLPLANFENLSLTPIQLVFGPVFRRSSSSKIFDAQLGKVPTAKDIA